MTTYSIEQINRIVDMLGYPQGNTAPSLIEARARVVAAIIGNPSIVVRAPMSSVRPPR